MRAVMSESLKDYRDHVGFREGKHYKATLFNSKQILLGLNCLDPGQVQPVHTHGGQDKFYLVLEGRGSFSVGEDRFDAGPGNVVWAPSEVEHGVRNEGTERLVLFVGMAPAPGP